MDNNLKLNMQEPLPPELSGYQERVRRNLLMFSMASIFFCKFNLEIGGQPRFVGIAVGGITNTILEISFFVFILYQLINFIWLMSNLIMYWRIRLTGTRVKVRRSDAGFFGTTNDPYDGNVQEEQSTFYAWMIDNQRNFISFPETISRCVDEICEHLSKVYSATGSENQSHQSIAREINNLSNKIESFRGAINNNTAAMENIRINESMRAFDNWFNVLVKSQSLRWFTLDLGLPVFCGIYALFLLGDKIINAEQICYSICEKF